MKQLASGRYSLSFAGLDRPLTGPLAIDSKPYQIVRDRLIDLK
jgi:hypothetical protein